MHECQPYHDMIAAYLVGDIGLSELEDLVAHCRGCEDCRGMVELHRSFATMATAEPEPSAEAFEAMRNRVLDQLESSWVRLGARVLQPPGVAGPRLPFWRALTDWFSAYPVPASAFVVLLLLAAALTGRWTAAPGWSEGSLLRAVEQQAGQSTGLDGFWDATFTFSNVAVRQTETGELALGFDVCRHVEAETPPSSPLAREVLLATIIDSPTLGVRLRAMEVAPDLEDSRLEEALIYTLHNDPNPTVRLQALGALSRSPLDPASQDALLTTLRDDASVQMRLEALQVLSEQQVDPATIRQAVSEAGQESDPVIMHLLAQMVEGL